MDGYGNQIAKRPLIKIFPTKDGIVFVIFDNLEHGPYIQATCNEHGEEVQALSQSEATEWMMKTRPDLTLAEAALRVSGPGGDYGYYPERIRRPGND